MSSKTPGRDSTSRSQSGLFVATFSTVLALIASGLNPLIPAEPAAATANVIATGTSPASVCNQVVDNNSGVTAQRLADGDCVVRFTAVRTTNWTAPSGVTQVTYLVVAGGGGGAGGHGSEHGGGGGGAGGVGTGTLNVSTATLSIAVGTGGAFGANRSRGTSGANSSLGAITMTGGGGGGTYYFGPLTGGSGGGAGAGAHLAGATGTLSQGNSGGSVNISGNEGRHGAGGGGAGGAGGNATSSGGSLTTGAGAGGAGSPSSITGSSLFYGGGGGGGGSSDNGGTGGASGGSSIGGAGATWTGSATTQATAGATNTGSGGGGGIGTGGSNDTVGGAGGSGVVIVRYALPPNAPTIDSVTGVNQSLSVAFTAPISNDATITGYQYSINNGSNWISTGGTTSPFAISGLTNGTPYTVLLRALSATSFSPASTSFSPASTGVTGTPLADCAPPATTPSGGFTYVAFKNLGTCNWTPSAGVTRVDILVVGGGGGGGSRHGGGGGGGGLIQETNVSIAGSALAITVGAGGAGGAGGGSPGASVDVGDKGEASVVSGVGITTRTANGGGGGGAHATSGGVGGSGGGGGAFVPALGGAVQTAGQGNAGSAGQNNGSTHYVGGGGGGAELPGIASTSSRAGSGGNGLEISWISSSIGHDLVVGTAGSSGRTFAGGGGGGSSSASGGFAGSGGGAVGAAGVALSSSGSTNTGGGGGGAGVGNAGSWPGGNGGSGVVVLRYINAPVISIANSTISATVGTAVTSYSISNSGGEIASYAISPALSVPGLTFSTVNGLISGSPSSAVTSASYTVTATNTSGTSSATFSITSFPSSCSPSNTFVNGFTVLQFRTLGSCSWSVPTGVTNLEILVVGGGGAGGATVGGGGGAGGYLYSASVGVTAGAINTITVGAGGLNSSTAAGGNGGNSSFNNSLVAIGGGGGGTATGINNDAARVGSNGGSGGGAASTSFSGGASPQVGTGTPGQGNNGGISFILGSTRYNGGGGGGLNGEGAAATESTGGKGGAGAPNSISGASVCYATGGGGALYSGTGTSGAAGDCGGTANPNGGSGGVRNAAAPTAVSANTGGGGGGGAQAGSTWTVRGTDGASGVVIVRYEMTTSTVLTPAFGTPTSTATGYTVQITNYSSLYTWAGTATASGSVAISNTGLVTVTGVAVRTSSTATITTARTGYPDGSSTVTGASASAPGAPNIGTVATVGRNAFIPFTAPESNGGSAIIRYTATSSPGGLTKTLDHSGNGTLTVENLILGTTYTFTVTATNTIGTSAPSAVSNSVTPRNAPGAPTSLIATAGNNQVALTWTAPASNGGSEISDYLVEFSTNGSTFTTVADGVSTSASSTVTGLVNGTAYTFRVSAINAAGTGAASTTTSATPGKASQTITFNAPSNRTLGTGTISVTASSSSSLVVALSSATTDVCTILSGTITLVAAGTCTIHADQAGNDAFLEATQVQRSFTVAPALTITTPSGAALQGTRNSAFNLTVAASGGAGSNVFTATGSLPTGVNLSTAGVLSGTPSTLGSFALTVTVTDANTATATTASFTISIAAETLTNVGTPTVIATSGTLKSIDVSWVQVANASSYTLKIFDAAGSNLLDTIVLANNLTSYTITDAAGGFEAIANGTQYQVSLTANGTGNYVTSDESAKAAVTTLAAYTISYNANQSTGGQVPANQTKTQGVNLTLATNSGTLVREGFIFGGWNTQADGLGTTYAGGASFTENSARELFAVWLSPLMAYEPFSGIGNLVGSAGTDSVGFLGNWELPNARKQDSAATSGIRTSRPSFDFPSNSGFTLPPSNVAASGPSWFMYNSARELGTPISFDADGTYYLSFISHTPSISVNHGSTMAGLLSGLPMDDADTGPWSLMFGSTYQGKFGIDYGNANRATWVDGQTRLTSDQYSSLGTKVSVGTTEETAFFVVAKITTSAAGNDEMSLRAYSPSETLPLSEPSDWDVQYSAAISGTARYFSVETEYQGTVDEVRLGRTYAAVADPRALFVAPTPPATDYSLELAGISRASARGGSAGSAVAIVPNSQSFSWEAWINPTAPTSFGQRYVLDSFSGSGSDGAARLWIQGTANNAVFAFRYDSAEAGRESVTWNSGTNYVRYGEWQHVAVTYQRSTEGDCSVGSTVTATLYIDGVQAGQNTGSNIGCLAPKGLSIGDATEDAFNNEFFAGKIDQVKIWEGALTQVEVAASMTSYARGTIDNTLRAHYGFNELGASAVAGDVVQNLAPSGSGYDLGLFSQTSSNVANNVTRSLNVFSVSYAGNGSTSGSVATETAGPYASVQIAGQGTLLRTSHAFNNWHTTASGTSGVNYAAGDSYQMSYFDLDLYAKWTSLIQTVTPTVAYGNAIFSPSLTITPTINTNNHDGSPTFTSTSQSVCTVNSATGVATVVRAGTCSISINFPLTAAYESATVTASFTIDKANQAALTWNQAQISYDYLGTLNLSAAISGGNVSPSGNLSFIGQGSCTATGSVVSGGAAGSSCSVTATLAGDSGYNPVSITQTITINKINQAALGIANPGTVTFGDTIQLSSTGGSGTGAISFSSASTSICAETANDGEFEIIAVGDCVVQVARAADTNYNSQSGSRTITSVKATHALSFTSAVPANPIVNGSYSVTGSSSTNQVGLSPSFRIVAGSSSICSLAGSTVSFLLDGVCEIEAFRGATNNYEAAQTITQRIVVGQANQSITFAALASKTFGDPAFTVSGTSSSANTVTFSSGSGTTNSACSVTSGGLVVIAAVGTCEIVANSASGNGYAAASPVARSFAIAPDTAGAPFITAVSFGDQSLTATYFAPGYLGGGTISGYRLQAFSGSNLVATQSSCAISGTLSCTITGLTNGTSYTLKIAAITEAGLGAESPSSAAVAPAANPEAVSGLTAVQGNQKLTISWRAPSNLGGGVLDSFRIFHRVAGGSYSQSYINLTQAQAQAATSSGVTTIEISNLINGQAYDVKVITVTTANTSQLTSNTAEVTQTPYSVPDAPLSVTVLEVGDDIVITWSQPVFDGGSAISGFSVLLDSVAATCTATSTTTCTISKNSLTPGTTINIAVKAENDAGLSAPSNTTFTMASAVVVGSPSVTTGPSIQTPDGPAAGIEAVTGQAWAWTKRISKNQVKVYIKFPEMGTNYQIRIQKNDGSFAREMSKTVNATSYEGLRVVGDWYYLVRTITLPGEGRYRIELTQDGQRMVLNGENRPAVYSYR